MTTRPGDLVLDPTCGSGTTAFVAEKWGRRWITCDTSRVALALARTRIMSASFPHYKLKNPANTEEGFHYNTVPHITLKDIANNKNIDAIWEKHEANLKPLRTTLGFDEDWQVPRDADSASSDSATTTSADLLRYNDLRRARQQEIDDAIRANASQEILYDQPLEDKSSARVAGPFTVESFSAYRFPSPHASNAEKNALQDQSRYITAAREQLKAAGIESAGSKKERISFSRIDPFAHPVISAVGHYLDRQEKPKEAAIAFGPPDASVGHAFLKQALIEATRLQHSLLVVCAFAFEPDFLENKQEQQKITVLCAKMHPDLSDPENPLLSKKGHSDNLFMIFGEPDIKQTTDSNGKVIVEILGVDTFNPLTSQITSSSTDEIACWFIDTNYTGECFFVRHAYFTGGKNPYKQLQKALKDDIGEEAWNSLHRNISRPFAKPATGRIAVKVINHYGDEVTKTFAIP